MIKSTNAECVSSRVAEREVLPSNRSFGLTFAVIGALAGGWLLWASSRYYWMAIAAAVLFLLLALIAPRLLRPLNRLWMRFGALLNRIVSPLILGAMYFLLITPIALLFKIRGRDVLKRNFDKRASSYWTDRSPPGPEGRTFPRQF